MDKFYVVYYDKVELFNQNVPISGYYTDNRRDSELFFPKKWYLGEFYKSIKDFERRLDIKLMGYEDTIHKFESNKSIKRQKKLNTLLVDKKEINYNINIFENKKVYVIEADGNSMILKGEIDYGEIYKHCIDEHRKELKRKARIAGF